MSTIVKQMQTSLFTLGDGGAPHLTSVAATHQISQYNI